ncbi:MAG TPA: hypothetical protein V6C58_28360 [Allocoleopsis sp.]
MTLKAAETRTLVEILQILMQIRGQILEMFKNTPDSIRTISDMPPSMIDTDLLFDIAVCFEGMFLELQNYRLLKEGHMKLSHTTH